MNNKLRNSAEEHIAKSGRSLIAVMPTIDDPDFVGFIYTIGNTEMKLPELLIVGTLNPQHTGRLLNDISDFMLITGTVAEDGLLDMGIEGWRMPFMVRKASERAKTDYTIQVGQYYGHDDYDVLQVLMPDKDGKYAGQGAAIGFEVELV